jgi:DNA-binding transcriptional LysR family regulator
MDSRVYDTSYITVSEEAVGVHFVASCSHPLAADENVTLERLMEENFLLTEKGMSYRRLMDESLAARSMEVLPVLEAAQADLICDLVAQNQGVSFLPDYVTQKAVEEGRMVRLNVQEVSVTVWKQLLYRRDKWVSPQMEAMISWLSRISLQEKT